MKRSAIVESRAQSQNLGSIITMDSTRMSIDNFEGNLKGKEKSPACGQAIT